MKPFYLGSSIIAQINMVDSAMADTTRTEPIIQLTGSPLVLGLTGEGWDGWLIAALVLAAFAGIAVVATTAGSVISHKREAERAQSELEMYKTEVAGKVADASTEGIKAGRTASDAVIRAEKLEAANLELERSLQPRDLIFERN